MDADAFLVMAQSEDFRAGWQALRERVFEAITIMTEQVYNRRVAPEGLQTVQDWRRRDARDTVWPQLASDVSILLDPHVDSFVLIATWPINNRETSHTGEWEFAATELTARALEGRLDAVRAEWDSLVEQEASRVATQVAQAAVTRDARDRAQYEKLRMRYAHPDAGGRGACGTEGCTH